MLRSHISNCFLCDGKDPETIILDSKLEISMSPGFALPEVISLRFPGSLFRVVSFGFYSFYRSVDGGVGVIVGDATLGPMTSLPLAKFIVWSPFGSKSNSRTSIPLLTKPEIVLINDLK